MRRLLKIVTLLGSFLLMGGCAALPDMNRLQNNMDQMVYNMGVMASSMPLMVDSTRRMADNADRMASKADKFMGRLPSEKKALERAVQNYSQAFIDNDKARLGALRAIRQELSDLKETLRKGGPVKSNDQGSMDRSLQNNMRELEARLEAISARVKEMEKKVP